MNSVSCRSLLLHTIPHIVQVVNLSSICPLQPRLQLIAEGSCDLSITKYQNSYTLFLSLLMLCCFLDKHSTVIGPLCHFE